MLQAKPLRSSSTGALAGTIRVPGDKSISHRSLMLGAVAVGETVIHGLLEGEDVLNTAAAMRLLGAQAERGGDGVWRVRGVGLGGLGEPAQVLDMGNSGTAARLLMGLVASHPITCVFTGDASLNKRPMARVTGPLEQMGARFVGRSGGRLPLAVVGSDRTVPITYRLPVASAQVKSAVILCGLNTAGTTTVIEAEPTRDHTELMLRHFGATVTTERMEDGALAVSVVGQPELTGREIVVPADPSSAAFPAVAALLRPGSELLLPGVGMNPRRTGLYDTLVEMGANIAFENRRDEAGEPVADLRVKHGPLKGIVVPADRAPSMIDEYPILAAAAACAEGTTVMLGLKELRVKESDRLAMVADGLTKCGVKVEVGADDSLTVYGTGKPPQGGATVATAMDHRIAMSFLVLGMATSEPVQVDDGAFIDTSFPGFVALMNGVGAKIAGA
ncbi:3-phosphoshikimate 1-carboxyvinyltransferase [Azospirillum baldaniorum]|uniref:3-phosphoshikimate 1-carboxyvinyltransferase n=1 Tax=Azospirillum baldaniorum TaxID=1064539 RepID=A0A9P1JNS8_9PROT|nr:3-phosphoshikimate 1-carboxyvinyltransferase [Azospirillum baldaniorum]AWJ90833.1 3-phosphoshikimate 1-carboxyvinyltransferase [Azospirillum baldaniorum]TWA69654.1 3-phosphoshikimate 1-carboxyvinyltransferase [Azospirillum baldaniorum]TWA79067.1 3-phosphoshikimate 1-carboxyvinyltransferase [Azospirillum brasilense]CCC96921.1 3-phosphoshikimate 1-carboxyvinyltransferase [Azospirillum baldaniorum]